MYQNIFLISSHCIDLNIIFSDPNEDQFQKIKDAKKERVAKNEYKRLRNIQKNSAKEKGLFSFSLFLIFDE